MNDECATNTEKSLVVAAFIGGLFAPGGGYGTGVKKGGRFLFDNVSKATFNNKTQSLLYHVSKHGKGRTALQYVNDAMNFFNKNKKLGKEIILNDGTVGMKIQTKINVGGKSIKQGGIWTKDGNLVTYWD